ncbi:hypothetical protein FRB99_002022 [Tulasnella sp. 403]|nr:hypothetical protein FRB99_002022 [Tulasnella sp. 403]
MDGLDISSLLPAALLLPPRLSAHKYLMVCTLTVAAWDTLVLSPRTWRLMKTKGWPLLKVTFHILRYLMPIEFTIVAVAFFDSKFSSNQCENFYLFEPIVSAFLLCVASFSLAVRLYAIWDKSKIVMGVLGSLLFLQIVTQAICCGFYRVVPLKEGQGCIAGPKHNWVGLYWLTPTLFYSAALGFAVMRSVKSQASKPINLWKLFLRDGLNLYGAIWIVNMINMLFWFIITPTGPSDTVKTIVTSMTVVLTTTMTLRVILGVRGSLAHGGTYTGMSTTSQSHSQPSNTSRPNPVHPQISTNGPPHARPSVSNQIRSVGANAQTFTIEEIRAKAERDWVVDGTSDHDDVDAKSGYVVDGDTDHQSAPGLKYAEKGSLQDDDSSSHQPKAPRDNLGVKVTIDREYSK